MLNSKTQSSSTSTNDKVLLSIDIELTEDQTVALEIREQDNINLKINEFCQKYSISDQVKVHLNNLVKQKIKTKIEECNTIVILYNQYNANLVEERSKAKSKSKTKRMTSPNKTEHISISPKSSNKYKNLKELMSNLDDEEIVKPNKPLITKRAKLYEDNAGSRLYQREMDHNILKEEKMRKIIEEIKEIDEKEATFKPDIGNNEKNNLYNSNRNVNIKIEDRLIAQGDQMKEKKMKEIIKKEESEKEELLSKPIFKAQSHRPGQGQGNRNGTNSRSPKKRINSPVKDNQISTGNNNSNNNDIDNNTPTDKSNIILINKGLRKDHSADSIHYQRTSQNTRSIKNDNNNDTPSFNNNNISVMKRDTNQEGHSEPQTESSTKTNLISNDYNLFALDTNNKPQEKAKRIYLKTESNKRSIRPSIQQRNSSFNNKQKPFRNKAKVMNMINEDNSAEVIFRLKFSKYKEIFDTLDTNHDGFISSKNIGLCAVPHWQLKALTPILEDLLRTQANMDFKEFCLKIGKLLTTQLLDENDLYIMNDHLGENVINAPK